MDKLYTFHKYGNNGLRESFDTDDLEKCLAEVRNKDRFQTCYVKCNFDPKLGMECLVYDDFYPNEGNLTLVFSDGGDGGSTDLDSLISFLVKAFPEKIATAQRFEQAKVRSFKVQQPTLDEMA
jgi:hypothetical protein